MTESPRVRFAPSPTGILHIGGARTAIYNWAFARHHGGTFVLRIDDTDPERSTQENTDMILHSMEWLGLDWDEGPGVGGDYGPYFQTERQDTYQQALEDLIASGNAYPCFCTAEELSAKREAARKRGDSFQGYDRKCRFIPRDEAQARIDAGEPHVWRIAVPEDQKFAEFDDALHGHMKIDTKELDDFVIMRSDGTPTYNFATVVDDVLMKMTHIIRGDDHLSNTPRQVIVFEALNYPVPLFAHLPMILGADGKKLSKRHGATGVTQFKDEGFLPDAMINYLALLGWSLDGETTIFSRQELIDNFTLERLGKNPAVFDMTKLEWMNGEYLTAMSAEEFAQDVLRPELLEAGFISQDSEQYDLAWLTKLAPLIQPRIKHTTEVADMTKFLFVGTDVEYDEKSVNKNIKKEGVDQILEAAIKALSALDDWNPENINDALEGVVEKLEVKKRLVFQAVRVGVCGSQVSPPLAESMVLLGKDLSIARLENVKDLAN